jgi:hypothetical protein
MVQQKQALLDGRHVVLRLDEVISINELNQRYFKLDSAAYCHP